MLAPQDAQDILGRINDLKVGDTEVSSDVRVTGRMSIANDVEMLDVASGIRGRSVHAHPVQYASQMSVDRQNKSATQLHRAGQRGEENEMLHAAGPAEAGKWRLLR